MQRIFNKETTKYIGKKVKVCGWVVAVRSHGKIVFVDLRDRSGCLQVVFATDKKARKQESKKADMDKLAQELRPEWVIEVIGVVNKRPEKMINPEMVTGQIELQAEALKILNRAKTPPFELGGDSRQIDEEIRLRYRYLDLRTQRMQKNLILRHKVVQFIRNFMDKQGFIEIETPLLTKSTPEGARDFIVPSRLQPGKFYALPQSPQQYKQLLMVAGIERYFQIAKCLRDEDPRADRQAEFTQLDIEMSFVKSEDVMNLTEELFIKLVKELCPLKKIQKIPFPRFTYKEAVAKYQTDRPDLRQDKKDQNVLAFCWIVDFPFFEETDDGKWTFTHNPFSAAKPEFIEDLLQKRNLKNILTTQYDIVLNGSEVAGGSIRNHQPEALEAVFAILGYQKKEIQAQFGHMLRAFQYGAPPHGGIALGLDRLVMLLAGESSIREVIAFPKTGDGRCLMMDIPSPVTKGQLDELHIRTIKLKDN